MKIDNTFFRVRDWSRLRRLIVVLNYKRECQSRMVQLRNEKMLLVTELDYHHKGLPKANEMKSKLSPRKSVDMAGRIDTE